MRTCRCSCRSWAEPAPFPVDEAPGPPGVFWFIADFRGHRCWRSGVLGGPRWRAGVLLRGRVGETGWRGRSLRLHGICSRPGRPPAAGRLATCRPRVPLGRAPGPGPARHATPANVRSRLRARPLQPVPAAARWGREARLGPSRPSTACAPAERCERGRSVQAAVPGGPGTGLFDDRGASSRTRSVRVRARDNALRSVR